jgi:hypothetical protein
MNRIHNVIILTTGAIEAHGQDVIDRAIRHALELKKNPILVLGTDGDEVLRCCHLIEQCDLVFDESENGSEFSSLKAGLHATVGAAFVLPLKQAIADKPVWSLVEDQLSTTNNDAFDLVRPVSAEDERPLYPCAVTPRGVQRLKTLPSNSNWDALSTVETRMLSVPKTQLQDL